MFLLFPCTDGSRWIEIHRIYHSKNHHRVSVVNKLTNKNLLITLEDKLIVKWPTRTNYMSAQNGKVILEFSSTKYKVNILMHTDK